MPIEIKNGTTIHRIWGDLKEAELLGIFQYQLSADAVCMAILPIQPEKCFLISVCHEDGKMRIFRREPASPSSPVGGR